MAIRVPYNEQKVDIAPIRIAQARPDGAGAAAGQNLARGIASMGQVADGIADQQYKLAQKEKEEQDRAELDRYELSVSALSGKLNAEAQTVKGAKVNAYENDLDLVQTFAQRFTTESAKISVPEHLKTKAEIVKNRYAGGLSNSVLKHQFSEIDKDREEQAQAAIALKVRMLADQPFDATRQISDAKAALLEDLSLRYSGDRLTLEKEKYLQAAMLQQAENAISANPDNLAAVKKAPQFEGVLTKDHWQKLEDLARQRTVQVVSDAKDKLFQDSLLPQMMNKQIIDLATVAKDPRYGVLTEKDATQALTVAKTIAAHNENTATDNVLGWIAQQRVQGVNVSNWNQIPTDFRKALVEHAPSRAITLQERFDAEQEIRNQRAAASKQARQDQSALTLEAMLNPGAIDQTALVGAIQSGMIDAKFGMALLKKVGQAGDTTGALHQQQFASILQNEVEALTAGITDTKQRQQRQKELLGEMNDVLSGAFNSTFEINKDSVNNALLKMRGAALKQTGVFGSTKQVSVWDVTADTRVKVDPRDAQTVGMVARRFGLTEAQAARRVELMRATGQDPRKLLTHRR